MISRDSNRSASGNISLAAKPVVAARAVAFIVVKRSEQGRAPRCLCVARARICKRRKEGQRAQRLRQVRRAMWRRHL